MLLPIGAYLPPLPPNLGRAVARESISCPRGLPVSGLSRAFMERERRSMSEPTMVGEVTAAKLAEGTPNSAADPRRDEVARGLLLPLESPSLSLGRRGSVDVRSRRSERVARKNFVPPGVFCPAASASSSSVSSSGTSTTILSTSELRRPLLDAECTVSLRLRASSS